MMFGNGVLKGRRDFYCFHQESSLFMYERVITF